MLLIDRRKRHRTDRRGIQDLDEADAGQHRNYQNGTWTPIASMALERQFYSSTVLPDGRVPCWEVKIQGNPSSDGYKSGRDLQSRHEYLDDHGLIS